MRALVQRTRFSAVHIEGQETVKCASGLTIFLGVRKGDSEKDADFLAGKVARLRIFEDENEKMNLSVQDIQGEVLMCRSLPYTETAAKEIGLDLIKQPIQKLPMSCTNILLRK